MFQQSRRVRALVLFSACLASQLGFTAPQGVSVVDQNGKVRVEIDGALFTEFHYKGAPHVYYHPILGPEGLPMTRNFPMSQEAEPDAADHPHHRSLWYSHGAVNGVDFWSESPKAGKIVHDKFIKLKSGPEEGIIHSANNWIAPDGTVILREEQLFRVHARPSSERLVDFEVTLKAGDQDVVMGDTKEGTMGIRVASTMRLKGKVGKGKIVLSTGIRDASTWGKRAAWCDYSGPVDGKTVGVAIFDHPDNPRHPTWWHVRDYGLFAANPFGIHDFEKKEPGAGDLKIPAGGSVTFRYRFFFHRGDETEGKVAERYAAYAADKIPSPARIK
jgi:hypothetical protein